MTCFSDAWSVHAFDMSGLQSERDVDFMCTGDCFLWDQDETHMQFLYYVMSHMRKDHNAGFIYSNTQAFEFSHPSKYKNDIALAFATGHLHQSRTFSS